MKMNLKARVVLALAVATYVVLGVIADMGRAMTPTHPVQHMLSVHVCVQGDDNCDGIMDEDESGWRCDQDGNGYCASVTLVRWFNECTDLFRADKLRNCRHAGQAMLRAHHIPAGAYVKGTPHVDPVLMIKRYPGPKVTHAWKPVSKRAVDGYWWPTGCKTITADTTWVKCSDGRWASS